MRPSACTCNIIDTHRSLAEFYQEEDDELRLPELIRSARLHIPGVVSALRAVEETSSAITLRKTTLCVAWMRYYRALGLQLESSVAAASDSEYTSTRIKSCALRTCLCFGRKPFHKLSVCKVCRKVYYCNKKCQTKSVPILNAVRIANDPSTEIGRRVVIQLCVKGCPGRHSH